MSYIICKKEDEVDKVTEKGQKMIPQGPKSAPKSIENTASNPTRKIMRKTDLPAAIRKQCLHLGVLAELMGWWKVVASARLPRTRNIIQKPSVFKLFQNK